MHTAKKKLPEWVENKIDENNRFPVTHGIFLYFTIELDFFVKVSQKRTKNLWNWTGIVLQKERRKEILSNYWIKIDGPVQANAKSKM